jgi:hypothetical protein
VQLCLLFALVIETLLLFIGLLQSNTCGPLTTTRGLTALTIAISFALLPIIFMVSSCIQKQVKKCRERYGMNEAHEMLPERVEMTYGPSSRKMRLIENFYGLVIASQIYYNND